MVDIVLKPKKRIFISLTILGILFIALITYCFWRVSQPGLADINAYLPTLFGVVGGILIAIFLCAVLGIVLAVMGIPIIPILYVWGWKTVNIFFPLAVFLGRVFNLPRQRIEQSFIELSNHLVRNQKIKVTPKQLLILTPHCIQLDTCPYKITRDIKNCHKCGRCNVGALLTLAERYDINMAVVNGGTLARQVVKNIRPRAIIAVACERDLTSGIQDVFPLPVLGVLNERPCGPCFNTRVDLKR
ncbi:MAG TPA: DUF116 domain-containing protein, partial [Candidatus Avacidaminococcus intestinavium]|nr:DUF116 domain-containing protein [Candidatus Avacidaminococcus intestinavium]